MKRLLTFCFFTLFAAQISAQSGLDNLGFENWSENNAFGNPQPNGLGSIGQTENTSDPMEGNSALSLTTKRFAISATDYDTAGVTLLGDISLSGVQLGSPYGKCPDSITGYIRYDLPNQDSGVVAGRVWKGTDTTSADTLLGGTLNNWTAFNIPFKPSGCGGVTPDSITLIFSSEAVLPEAGLNVGTQTPGMGSFELDGVEVWANGTSTSLSSLAKEVASFGAHPNPASSSIRFEFSEEAARIKIFDMTGRSVRTVQVAQAKDEKQIQVNDLNRGMYLYRVEDQKGRQLYSDKLQIVR